VKLLRLIAALLFLPIPAIAAPGILSDCATSPQSVVSGGTDQIQLAANNQRTTVWIENYCSATTQGIGSAESIWVNFGAAAAVGTGFELSACGSQVFQGNYPVTQALHIFASTTGHQFACKANK
jgi:hypothetical protein